MSDPRAIENLLAFWADAGVEALYETEPQDRTAPPAPGRTAPPRTAGPTQSKPSTSRDPTIPDASSGPARTSPPPLISTRVDEAALAEARGLAAGAQDLEELRAAIAAFDGCPLKAGARQAVFCRGRADAPVMVIGEAPGAEEDVQGAPFVGRAGQLLDRMFSAAGLNERVFITNTVFWRPPGNRTPTPPEQAVCAPFLERAIALVNPRLLLLVGGASAKSMLRTSEGILSLRGRWFEWRSSDGALEIPALPTLHPAFLLRQPAAKKKSWEDLLLLTERLDRPHRPT